MGYDKSKADKAVQFFKCLKHTKGKWAGVPFDLLPWQEHEIIRPLFGTVKANGKRQYKTCYVEIPKKNGKSELAAGIALLMLFADQEPGAEVFSAAADKLQASIVFNVAAQMVRQNATLKKSCKIVDSVKRIAVAKTDSFYRVLSAEAYTKHGLNPSAVVFDELHAQPGRDLWDILTVGSGDAREQQLIFAITTAGYDRNSICYEIHDYALKVRSGVIEDETFLPVVYSLDEDADWDSEDNWYDANPSLGTVIDIEKVREAYKKAKELPANENLFRRLRLNQWTRSETRWLPLDKWDLCAGIIDKKELIGRQCYAGLDLASTTDIAAYVLVFPPEEDGIYDVLPYFWIPEENMAERVRKDRVPYDQWTKQGFIEPTPGNVIDYGYIKQTIGDTAKLFDVREVAFDRWGATKLVQDIEELNLTMVEFGQGYKSMSAPTKELMNLVMSGRLNHGGNPVLRWMCDNMVVTTDPAANIKPVKNKSTEKIDGMVALIMGLDRAVRHLSGKSVYETRGLITV